MKRVESGPIPARLAVPSGGAQMKMRSVSMLLLSCGCFSYRNTSVSDAALMAPVRVELTEAGTQELAGQVGPRGSVLEGVLTSKSESALIFGVTALTRMNGVEETWRGERVTVPRSSVSRIQLRKFSAFNTGLFMAGLVAGGLLVQAAADSDNIMGNPSRPPGTDQ